MQTFITESQANSSGPLDICHKTAETLDLARLDKQRLECQEIILALETGKGYIHHPATKMWSGHVEALAVYGFYMCKEFSARGNNDSLASWFVNRAPDHDNINWPWWFGHPLMVACHRSKLLRKKAVHYVPLFCTPKTEEVFAAKVFEIYELYRLPYLWPNPDMPQEFTISAAEYKREDFTTPDNWVIKSDRQVKFL